MRRRVEVGVGPSYQLRVAAISLVCVVFLSSTLLSQTAGSISGTVMDSSGSVIPRASLVLKNTGTGQVREAESSESGNFNFPDLAPGPYSLTVSVSGFKELRLDSLVLTVGQTMTVRPVLEIGERTEVVEVMGTTPPVTTASSSISHLVDQKQIEQLPLNGRNALQLVALAPGTVSVGKYGQFGAMQESFSISGSRIVDANYSLDGGFHINQFYNNAVEYPNPDALQEFAVKPRNYSAAFGRGVGLVSAVTRSGTNNLHGSLFEFLRNTQLDARPFFATKRSDFKRNQYGGTVGGPIIKDKLFFFVGYQGTKERGTPSETTYRTLSAAERTGDFSTTSRPVIDPNTGQPFPNNRIPADRIKPFAKQFISEFLPAANSGTDFFTFAPKFELNQEQVITRVDYSLTKKDNVFIRYLFNDVPQRGNGVSAFLDSSWLADLPTRNQSWTLGYTRVFSSTLINDMRFTHVRNAYGVITTKDFSLNGLGLDVNVANAISDFGLTPDSRISVGGFFGASPGVPTRDIVPTTHFNNTTSWIGNKHKVEFGVEIYHNRVNQLQNFLTAGTINFSGAFTGNGAADFLLGRFNDYRQITPLITRLRQTMPALFVEDEYRVRPRLTLNLGLRWDPSLGWESENDVLSTFTPGVQSTQYPNMGLGALYPGDQGLPRSIVGNRSDNFAPRAGLAWDVRGNGKTSIRVGGGIFYFATTRGISFNRFPLIQPFALDVSLFGGDTDNLWAAAPFNGVNPYPVPDVSDKEGLKNVKFIPSAGFTAFSLPFKTQTSNQWSLSVQQAMWGNSVLEVNYVANSNSHMFSSREFNPAVYIPGQSTIANTQARRRFPHFGAINHTVDDLSSNYNSLQITFDKRYAAGLALRSSYTWGKGLGVLGSFGEGSNGQRNPDNRNLDYGRTDQDIRQTWVTSFIWSLPFAQWANSSVVKSIVDGWQVTGITTFRTGFPFTVRSGRDNSLTAIGGDTPNQVGEWTFEDGRSKGEEILQWFNPTAFVQNPTGTFGTVGINSLTGPGFWNIDLAASRLFKLAEGRTIEFRTSFYNALNHANLNNPVNTLTSPIFGRILSATPPRVIEFGLRFAF